MKDATESRGQLILDVAKAASSHLDLSDVLRALMLRLKHTIRFDAIAVLVIEGDHARLHEVHTETSERKPGESLKNFVGRLHPDVVVQLPFS